MVKLKALSYLIIPMFLGSVSALSSFEFLQVTKDFADAFMPSNSSDLIADLNSKKALFAEDVKGSVDIAGNVDGRDYSTEFLFELFLGASQNPSESSPIGVPISYNVTAAAVQHNTVSAGIKFELEYPILATTYPVELEAFLTINDNKEITQYDLIFRRWSWAIDTNIPQLTPYMAKILNSTSTNSTLTLHQFLALASCTETMKHCKGDELQFGSIKECIASASTTPIGQFYRVGENNLACRAVHSPLLQLDPKTYCSAMSKSGGNFCINRDYIGTVRENHFYQGFLAPKYVTPEYQNLVKDVWASSDIKELGPLLEISMSSQDIHSWDPTFYATMTFVYFIFYYFFAKATDFIFHRFNRAYKDLPREYQKNVTMYFMTIVFTTIALALQLVGSPGFRNEWHYWEIQCSRLAGVLTVALYLFELIFRFNMRLPLVAHHILTISAISLLITTMEIAQNPKFMLSGIICLLTRKPCKLFQATTEQPTFVGLIGYRLKWKKETVSMILKVSAIQTFVFKAASALAVLIYWGLHQNFNCNPINIVWSVFVWIIAVGLMLTQVWGSYITYMIGVNMLKKKRSNPSLKVDSQNHSDIDLEQGRRHVQQDSGTITPDERSLLGYNEEMIRERPYINDVGIGSSTSGFTAAHQYVEQQYSTYDGEKGRSQ